MISRNHINIILLILFMISLGNNYLITRLDNTSIIYFGIFFLLLIFSIPKFIFDGKYNLKLGNYILLLTFLLILFWKLYILPSSPFIEQGYENIKNYIFLIVTTYLVVTSLYNLKFFLLSVYISVISLNVFSIIGGLVLGITQTVSRVSVNGEIVNRYSWLFTHPNTAGLHAMIMVIISLYFFEKFKTKIHLLFTLFGFIMIYLTDSRTSFLLCIIYILLRFGELLYKNIKSENIKSLIILESFLAIILCVFVIIYLFSNHLDEINNLISGRLIIWKTVLSTIDNIMVGVGLFLPGKNLVYSQEIHGYDLDGLFVNIIYNEGIVGLILFVLLILILFVNLVKTKSTEKHFAINILIITIIFSIIETHFWTFNFLSCFVLGTIFTVLKER